MLEFGSRVDSCKPFLDRLPDDQNPAPAKQVAVDLFTAQPNSNIFDTPPAQGLCYDPMINRCMSVKMRELTMKREVWS